MLTERLATYFGIAAVALMVVLLMLVWFRLVPASWEIPLFVAASALFAARLVVRMMIARRDHPPTPPAPPPEQP